MLNQIRKSSRHPIKSYNEDVVHVQSHLTVTPSEMLELSKHGVPIASQMRPDMFYDGDNSPVVDLAPEFRRGFDVNDAWNAEMDAKVKLRHLVKSQPKSD